MEKLTKKEALDAGYVSCGSKEAGYILQIADLAESEIIARKDRYIIVHNEPLQYLMEDKTLKGILKRYFEEVQDTLSDDENILSAAVEHMELKPILREMNKEFIRLVKHRWHLETDFELVSEEEKYPDIEINED